MVGVCAPIEIKFQAQYFMRGSVAALQKQNAGARQTLSAERCRRIEQPRRKDVISVGVASRQQADILPMG
jgi:hypothetical protein